MGDSKFDPDLQRDLHSFTPVTTQYQELTVIIQQYDEKLPEIWTKRTNAYGKKKMRKLGRFKLEELEQIIPIYIEAYKWLQEWKKVNYRD